MIYELCFISFDPLVSPIPFKDVILETCYRYPRKICLFQLESFQTVSASFPHYQGERGIASRRSPIWKFRGCSSKNIYFALLTYWPSIFDTCGQKNASAENITWSEMNNKYRKRNGERGNWYLLLHWTDLNLHCTYALELYVSFSFAAIENQIMRRHTLLVLLWFFLGLLIRTTHARHNITAALVALAPVPDTDGSQTALDINDKDGNESSTVTANWILLSTAITLQSILLLLRWFKGS